MDQRTRLGRDTFELHEDGTGCEWQHFITAVGTFVYCRMAMPGRTWPTVREIGDAFEVQDDVVRQAVREHPWMFTLDQADATRQRVELDGE